MLRVDDYAIEVSLPFITMILATTKDAKGVDIFGKYF